MLLRSRERQQQGLIAFVRERLGPVQTPKQVHFYESLPRSPVGKVLKAAVRERAVAGGAATSATSSSSSTATVQ